MSGLFTYVTPGLVVLYIIVGFILGLAYVGLMSILNRDRY